MKKDLGHNHWQQPAKYSSMELDFGQLCFRILLLSGVKSMDATLVGWVRYWQSEANPNCL